MSSWHKALERLEGAYSDHTLRSYRSGFATFSAWCRRRRLRALPASAETVAAYIQDEGQRLKPATIRQRLAGVRKVHRLLGHRDPTDGTQVDLAMRRARRAQPTRPQQAGGITADLRDQLLSACSEDLRGLRNKVMVSVGFDTLCRRGELVSITIEDISRTHQGRYTVLVRRAKNDPDGTGRTAHLSTRSGELVEQWLKAIGAGTGPLLRPVYGERALALQLAPSTISRILKKLASRSNASPTFGRVSGHSLRVGAAQQLALEGRPILQIMRVGGWRSMNVVARYIENMQVDVWE